jgi:pyruvate,water dikinase
VALTLPLGDPRATLESAGGKGASLARLSAAGLPVPDGFHITTEAYRQFVAANKIGAAIREELDTADRAIPSTLEAVSKAISKRFLDGQMPAEIARAVTQAYARLGGTDLPVAVRSSATAEDLPGLSFAGQQDTYLNVRGVEALLASVKRCWASLWSARAIGYRSRNGVDQDPLTLAVVVQRLVPAEASGVLFTANPVSGRGDQAMISAAWGLGEALVGGKVTPDTLVIDKPTGRVLARDTADKQLMTVLHEEGTGEQGVSDAKRRAAVLGDQAAAGLVRMGVQIEELYGRPMDIEWALSGGKFAILQARPITALPEAQREPSVEWKLPDPKATYMRASIIEQLPEPLTPLFSTLAGPIINEATRALFAWMVGGKELKPEIVLFETINGYAYLNWHFGLWDTVRVSVASAVRANSIFRLSEARWRQARSHYLEVVRSCQGKAPRDYTAQELLQGVRTLTGEAVNMYTVLQTGPVMTAGTSEMMFTQLYNRLIKKKGDPDASAFLLGFESAPIRAERSLYELAEWARQCAGLAVHLSNTPAAHLAAELKSADPPAGVKVEEWGEWRRRMQDHLARYGYFTFDLDFSKAVAADDPAPLLETCRMYLLGKAGSPCDRVRDIVARREQATQAMLRRLRGPKRWIFRRQLRSAQRYAPLREDGLSDLGLGYPLLRQLARELGRRMVGAGALERPEDVFWLNEPEVRQAAAALDQGLPLFSRLDAVRHRRALWRAEQRLAPPLVLPLGSRWMGMDVEKLTTAGESADPRVIKGFGASQGRVTAAARVLLGPEDFDQLRPGDVLVAPITTPGWTPLFALASAIVTDIGGPLSHSSIVAREYGIPAVLGTVNATRRIRSGQTITVDGGAGTVQISDPQGS